MVTPLVPTLTARRWPYAHTTLRNLALAAGGALLVAALAQVRIPLPFTPVPLTGQTFGVLLIGALFGARLGVASLGLYLALGLAGLPVFTGGGSGLAHLFGPTGGYLVGFVAAAFLTGSLAERGLERRWQTSFVPFLLGEAAIYLCALPWLALFVGPENTLQAGFWPFIVGDLIKLVLAALILPSAWRLVRPR